MPQNAKKHSWLMDKKFTRPSPAKLSISRATEKFSKNQKDFTYSVALSDIAGVEDQMASAERNDNENAAQPLPSDIPRVFHPPSLHRADKMATGLEQWQADVEKQRGQSRS